MQEYKDKNALIDEIKKTAGLFIKTMRHFKRTGFIAAVAFLMLFIDYVGFRLARSSK